MKIAVDENIPRKTVTALQAMGHEVIDIRGMTQEGMDDSALWKLAQAQDALLITTDKGFAHFRDEPHKGILIIRLRQPDREKIHSRVMQAMSQFSINEWKCLLVIMKDRVQSVWRLESDPPAGA